MWAMPYHTATTKRYHTKSSSLQEVVIVLGHGHQEDLDLVLTAQKDSLGNYSNNFEQQGEIIFESSIEYRHKIFGFVYGAAFLDAGNIWTIRADGSRPGADFSFNRFYKEIAVGTGYGLRFDFNFLLMRFDAGLKLYDPSGPKGARFIGDSGFRDSTYKNYQRVVFNIGIGYPF